jgi:hypothetical protein
MLLFTRVYIGLYEYGHEQVKLKKKRWNNKEILLKINMQTEILKKGEGGGNSVPQVPVI